jgi:hypothetical protein
LKAEADAAKKSDIKKCAAPYIFGLVTPSFNFLVSDCILLQFREAAGLLAVGG